MFRSSRWSCWHKLIMYTMAERAQTMYLHIQHQAEKNSSVLLASSASALDNNLVVRYLPDKPDAVCTAVIHRGTANITPTKAAPSQIGQPSQVLCLGGNCVRPTSIMQVMFVETAKRTYFVVTSTFGIQVFDEGGSVILFSHTLDDSSSPKNGSFAKGIAQLKDYSKGEEIAWFCVGTNNGNIMVFSVSGLDISLTSTIQAHNYSISCVAGTGGNLVSGDDSGALQTWSLQSEGHLNKVAALRSCNWACTSVAIYGEKEEKYAIAAFGCGHLRIYKLDSLELCAEVAAHARWITAIDIAHSRLLCVSASEDSFIRVWQLTTSPQPISLLLSLCIPHQMIVGARFLNMEGSQVCLACYDSSELLCYDLQDINSETS